MANPNPNFFLVFLDGIKHNNEYVDGFVDAYRGNAGIWYQDDMGWPDLLSKRRGDCDMVMKAMKITCMNPRNSLARSLMPMQQLSTLYDIRNSTHLRT